MEEVIFCKALKSPESKWIQGLFFCFNAYLSGRKLDEMRRTEKEQSAEKKIIPRGSKKEEKIMANGNAEVKAATVGTVNTVSRSSKSIHHLAAAGVLSAAAYVLMLIELPLPMIMPTFIKFDFSDLPALVGAFALGPVYGVAIELIKNLLHGLASQSFGVGELSNFLLGAVFTFTAGAIYKYNKTKKGAILASLIGALAMAVISVPSNYFIVYPVYYNFMPEETILAAYQAILPSMKSILQSLLVFNMPFTFCKGLADVLVTFLIYKHISPLLKG
jgi:riboflavin transporter FmnP